jgi:hypothetical protein
MTSSKLTLHLQNTWLQPKDIANIKYMDFVHPDDKKNVAAILATLSKENPAVNFKDRILCKEHINGSTGMSILTSKTTFCILQLEILLRTY